MFVVKIGGSLIFDNREQINGDLISEYGKTIGNLLKTTKKRFAIVVGGGKIARKYINSLQRLGASEANNDLIGIEVAKLNARLVIGSLGDLAYPFPPNNFDEFQSLFSLTNKVIVCGGFQPGQSTNAVATAIAEATAAEKLINLTDVDGVFTGDPEKDPNAKLQETISIDELINLIANKKAKPGHYPLFDFTASQIVRRSKINLHFVNGNQPKNLAKAIHGEKIGTLVTH